MTLREQGFRYVYQRGHYDWVHPNDIQPDAIDCTDMDDQEFEAQVARTHGLQRSSAAQSASSPPVSRVSLTCDTEPGIDTAWRQQNASAKP